jgi:hypothetical protein
LAAGFIEGKLRLEKALDSEESIVGQVGENQLVLLIFRFKLMHQLQGAIQEIIYSCNFLSFFKNKRSVLV